MKQLNRIIDANINRTAEGLRVLEDLSRFVFENAEITETLRNMRHEVRKAVAQLSPMLISERDASGDIGLDISQKTDLDNKAHLRDLVSGNFKRVQEGLRVVEENLKVAGRYELSKIYETLRYRIYSIEKDYGAMLDKYLRKKVLDTDIYCLTSEEHSNGRSNIEVVRQMIDAGVKIIQYREKDKKTGEKYAECVKIREMTKDAGVCFLVNDDIDLALMADADGVHIGQGDFPIEAVRRIVGEKMIIGLSTHSPEEARDAVERGADYIGVGPIFKTYTKKDVCDPVGFEYLEFVAENIDIPFVAIGGIKEHNVADIAMRGAGCVAMITEIVGSSDIKQKIHDVRKRMLEAKE